MCDSAEVFVYHDDALHRLDTYQKVPLCSGMASIACSSNEDKIIAFLANGTKEPYIWQPSNSYEYIEELESDFMQERAEAPTMSGICHYPDETIVELRPLGSRIILRSICCDFSSKPYARATLEQGKVYLTNVSSICKTFEFEHFPTRGTLNTGGLNELDLSHLSSPMLIYQDLPDEIGPKRLEVNKVLYCYPNTNEDDTPISPYTRLVIEGKIDGRTWYYPININRGPFSRVQGSEGIDRGKSYIYDLTILRKGSTDPDMSVSPLEVKLDFAIVPWEEKGERDEIF